jgi:shikimate dehydrogenase
MCETKTLHKIIMKQYGLIGYPLGHSFSKKYFEDKFITENISNASFQLFPIEDIVEFKSIIETNKNLQGLAVTIPHKQEVMSLLHSISPEATAIGAVNCISIQNGITTGYNTDVVGFELSLKPLLQPQHTHALVLGTGGASKAVQYVLKKLKIPFILVSRTKNEAQNIICYEDINQNLIKQHTLIINTTPLGMTPDEVSMPNIPYNFLTPNHLLYDLIYKPAQTLFLQKGEQQGCATKNGFEMLILQAEKNWEIWNR